MFVTKSPRSDQNFIGIKAYVNYGFGINVCLIPGRSEAAAGVPLRPLLAQEDGGLAAGGRHLGQRAVQEAAPLRAVQQAVEDSGGEQLHGARGQLA